MNDAPLATAKQDGSFVGRDGHQRKLKYRAVLKIIYFGLLGLAGVSVVGGLIYTGIAISQSAYLNPLSLVVFLVAVPFAAVGLARVRFRPYAFTTVHIRPDGFTLERPWGNTDVKFTSVRTAKVWHLPYLGGRLSLTDDSGAIYQFTAALERSEYLADAFRQARPELLNDAGLLRYRRTVISSDHSWARLNDRVRLRRKELGALFVLLPILGFAATWPFYPGKGVFDFMAVFTTLVLVNTAIGLLASTAAEYYLILKGRRALLRNPNEARRDMDREARVNRVLVWAHLGLFCFFLGALTIALAPQ